MGTDIHLNIEKKNRDTNKWEEVQLYYKDINSNYIVADPYKGRSYLLFGYLANVREKGHTFKEPTYTLPNDLSDSVKAFYEFWKMELHSPTWYTLPELKQYIEKVLNKEDKIILDDFIFQIEYYISLSSNGIYNDNDIRLIMWFD